MEIVRASPLPAVPACADIRRAGKPRKTREARKLHDSHQWPAVAFGSSAGLRPRDRTASRQPNFDFQRMVRLRVFTLWALFLVGGLAPAALAQPLILPGARLPLGAEAPAGVPTDPAGPSQGAALPAQPAPRPAKVPGEETILNRDLRLNGAAGSLRVEHAGKSDLRAKIALAGTRLSNPGEACSLK